MSGESKMKETARAELVEARANVKEIRSSFDKLRMSGLFVGLNGIFVVLFLTAFVSAAEVTTLADLRFLGGQQFFQGSASSVGGNLDAMVTPSVAFNDRWSLVPTWQGEYRGTRDVQELAGGGTLFQDSTRQSLTAKTVYTAGSWKYKATVGTAFEWLRETKDEKWGSGLFDNRKYSGGVESEYDVSKTMGARLAYDYYSLTFPHYKSLETATDPSLARELAGTKTLDSGNHLFTFSLWAPFPGEGRAELGAYYNLRSFNDQNVLNGEGQFTGTGRADETLSVSAGVESRPYSVGGSARALASLGVSYQANDSNQNHYDAVNAVYVPSYYNYSQWDLRPEINVALGAEKPWIFSVSVDYTRRGYSDRPAQDSAGNYLTAKTRVSLTTASLGVTYPWSKNFKIRAAGNLAWSDSNMKYEQLFRYNYKIANYLVGFSYEY